MTALNVAVTADRIAIFVDSLVSGSGVAPCYTSKCLAFPGHQMLVAATGHLQLLQCATLLMLSGFPEGTMFDDFLAELPEQLQAAWQRIPNHRSSYLVIAGVTGDNVAAAELDSPDFLPRHLERGVWVNPQLRAGDDATPPEVSPANEPVSPLPPMPPEVATLTCAQLMRAAIDIAPLQKQQHPDSIGGWLHVTELTPYAIHTTRLRNLDDDE